MAPRGLGIASETPRPPPADHGSPWQGNCSEPTCFPIAGSDRGHAWGPDQVPPSARERKGDMSRLWAREFSSTAVMPLAAAAYCADCEALFDMRQQHQSCPACASRTIVP